jgi:hypothetical protein
MKKIIALFFFLLAFLLVIVFWQWKFIARTSVEKPVNSFEQCAQAGYQILESYPRQCRTPSGKLFFEIISEPARK